MTWRDVRTDPPPKDGTRVLLICMRPSADMAHKKGLMAVDYWHDEKTAPGCGYVGWGKFNKQYWDASHWAHLPEPPKDAT